MIRQTWAEVNLDHIGYNIRQMKKKLPQNTEMISVVKADGYGHGSVQVAKKALESGASALAVALLEEALVLREAGIQAPILVLGYVPAQFTPLASENDITLTFFQLDWLKELHQYSFEKQLHLHMKWDTGMGRIGITSEKELIDILEELKKHPDVSCNGIFTHFAAADEEDLGFFHQQKERFNRMLDLFQEKTSQPVSVHVGNSAASIRFPADMYDYIRFGVAMYGLYPSSAVRAENEISLKPSFSLFSKLVHVKQVSAGETVSYGQAYTAERDEWIGTIPIGYGDGWSRKLQGFHVLVNGKHMPIVGKVCMDMMMVKLDQKYEVGTEVTLIGEQKGASISMDDVADYLETINYEIPCMLNDRVPRKYVSENTK